MVGRWAGYKNINFDLNAVLVNLSSKNINKRHEKILYFMGYYSC